MVTFRLKNKIRETQLTTFRVFLHCSPKIFHQISRRETRLVVVQHLPLLDEAEWIIGNTVYELESEASDAVQQTATPIYSLRPFLPSVYLEAECKHQEMSMNPTSLSLWAEMDCSQWLDSKARSSVLYVSFGSMVRMSKAQVEEIAMGLLESEQTFLWVVHPGILNFDNDANDHAGILPQGFLEKVKNQALVVPWATQLTVLSHDSIRGFFAHGGWNSTMESLSLGVPMLVFPQWLDQYTNRMLVVNQWKIGLKLETCRDDGVERGEIARAAKCLLGRKEGEEMGRDVCRWYKHSHTTTRMRRKEAQFFGSKSHDGIIHMAGFHSLYSLYQ